MIVNPFRLGFWKRNSKTMSCETMIKQCSINGDGKHVYCEHCGDHLNAKTIGGMDQDGNAYCNACVGRN